MFPTPASNKRELSLSLISLSFFLSLSLSVTHTLSCKILRAENAETDTEISRVSSYAHLSERQGTARCFALPAAFSAQIGIEHFVCLSVTFSSIVFVLRSRFVCLFVCPCVSFCAQVVCVHVRGRLRLIWCTNSRCVIS